MFFFPRPTSPLQALTDAAVEAIGTVATILRFRAELRRPENAHLHSGYHALVRRKERLLASLDTYTAEVLCPEDCSVAHVSSEIAVVDHAIAMLKDDVLAARTQRLLNEILASSA